jgi:hypothetical protein
MRFVLVPSKRRRHPISFQDTRISEFPQLLESGFWEASGDQRTGQGKSNALLSQPPPPMSSAQIQPPFSGSAVLVSDFLMPDYPSKSLLLRCALSTVRRRKRLAPASATVLVQSAAQLLSRLSVAQQLPQARAAPNGAAGSSVRRELPPRSFGQRCFVDPVYFDR